MNASSRPHANEMADRAAQFFGLGEEHRRFLEQTLADDGCWLLSANVDGVRIIRIPAANASERWLLARANGGARFSNDGALGPAELMVLSGACLENGRAVSAGEMLHADDAPPRVWTVPADSECIVAIRKPAQKSGGTGS